jgi:hypothetical protein
MAINAKNNGNTPRELIPAGNYLARCYKMIHIGTVEELILGEKKIMNKVRIGWELPTELKVFSQEKGEQPLVIENEYTLSLHEKSSLRKLLASWRGKDFTEKEAESFDITKLLGVQCMLNIIHKPGKKDPTKIYEQIAGVTAVPKGIVVPAQINETFELSYDDKWSDEKFKALPEFIRNKMITSVEYKAMDNPAHNELKNDTDEDLNGRNGADDDLPF